MEMQTDHPVNTAGPGGPTQVRMTVAGVWMEGWQGQSEPLQGQSQGLGGILPVGVSRGAGGQGGREREAVGWGFLPFGLEDRRLERKKGRGSPGRRPALRLRQEAPGGVRIEIRSMQKRQEVVPLPWLVFREGGAVKGACGEAVAVPLQAWSGTLQGLGTLTWELGPPGSQVWGAHWVLRDAVGAT